MEKLEVRGVTDLNVEEMRVTEGGISVSGLGKGSVYFWLVQQVVANWEDIKAGAKAGYNAKI